MANKLPLEKKVAVISMLCEGSSIRAVERITGVNQNTVPVHEVFRGQTVWKGEVERFDLDGHPKAKRAYGWSHREGPDDQGERFVTVLEIPPVRSPETAVRASIMADSKAKK